MPRDQPKGSRAEEAGDGDQDGKPQSLSRFGAGGDIGASRGGPEDRAPDANSDGPEPEVGLGLLKVRTYPLHANVDVGRRHGYLIRGSTQRPERSKLPLQVRFE